MIHFIFITSFTLWLLLICQQHPVSSAGSNFMVSCFFPPPHLLHSFPSLFFHHPLPLLLSISHSFILWQKSSFSLKTKCIVQNWIIPRTYDQEWNLVVPRPWILIPLLFFHRQTFSNILSFVCGTMSWILERMNVCDRSSSWFFLRKKREDKERKRERKKERERERRLKEGRETQSQGDSFMHLNMNCVKMKKRSDLRLNRDWLFTLDQGRKEEKGSNRNLVNLWTKKLEWFQRCVCDQSPWKNMDERKEGRIWVMRIFNSKCGPFQVSLSFFVLLSLSLSFFVPLFHVWKKGNERKAFRWYISRWHLQQRIFFMSCKSPSI